MARTATPDDELEDDGAQLIVDEEMEQQEGDEPDSDADLADDDRADTDDSTVLTESEDDDEANSDEEPAPDASTDEQPDTDGDTAEGEDAPESADESGDTAGDAPAPVPFTFQGDKATHTLEGAELFTGHGLWVPESSLPKLKETLAAGARHLGTWQQERRQFEDQITELQSTRSEEIQIAEQIVELAFKDLAALDEDGLYEWAVNFKRNLPQLKADVRQSHLDKREATLTARAERASQPTPEQQAQERQQVTESALAQVDVILAPIFAHEDMKLLTKSDKAKITERAKADPLKWVRRASTDLPEFGVKKGELYLDTAEIGRMIADRLEIREEEAARQATIKKVNLVRDRKLGRSATGKKVPAAPTAVKETVAADDSELSYEEKRKRWRDRMELD